MIRTPTKKFFVFALLAPFLSCSSNSETQPPDLRDSVVAAQGTLTQSGWPRPATRERAPVRSASNDPLWKVAKRACSGTPDNNSSLLQAVQLDAPTYFYREKPSPEILLIPTGFCPTPPEVSNVVFLIGRLQRGISYYYKISPQGEGIMEAAESHFDPQVNDIVYKRISPIRRENGRNVYAANIESDYKELLSTTVTRWGHFAPVISSNR